MKKFIFIVALALFLLPIVLSGNRYFLGGDDGGLYYLYPEKFITNFASNIVADNTIAGASMGYNTLLFYVPFLIVVYFIKQVPLINTQGLMYGLNISLGFVFFYLLLNIWIKDLGLRSTVIKIISSILYIFSPFLVGTAYTNQYIAVYLISIIPATVYFFVRGIVEKKLQFIIICILIFSIFSSILLTFPWWSAFILAFLPFIFYFFLKNPSNFIKCFAYGSIVFLLINFYWIFHFVFSYLTSGNGQSTLGFYSGSEITSENIRISEGVSETFSPLNVVFQNTSSISPTKWNIPSYFNIFYICVILAAATIVVRKQSTKIANVYFLSIFSLVISWFLYSPNLGNWGPKIFVFLVKNIPFFGAFRNMYDKFAMPLAFFYALSFAIGTTIITNYYKKIYKYLIFASAFILIFWIKNYINLYSNESIISRRVSGVFEKEYVDLIDYVKNIKNESRIIWLPLNSPTYTYIRDGIFSESYYSGVSPMRILANKTDYSGRFSFIIPNDLFMGDRIVFELIPQKKFQEVGLILQKLNVRYLIVDHRVLPDDIQDYYYDQDRKIIDAQTHDFYEEILGEKIKDFGNKFSLYTIKEKYLSDKIMLNTDESGPDGINSTYQKVKSYNYLVDVERLKNNSNLIFKEAFDSRWNLYISNEKQKIRYDLKVKNIPEDDFGNKWVIDENYVKNNFPSDFYHTNEDGSINIKLEIYFEPQKYVLPSIAVSTIAFLTVIAYCVIFPNVKRVRH